MATVPEKSFIMLSSIQGTFLPKGLELHPDPVGLELLPEGDRVMKEPVPVRYRLRLTSQMTLEGKVL